MSETTRLVSPSGAAAVAKPNAFMILTSDVVSALVKPPAELASNESAPDPAAQSAQSDAVSNPTIELAPRSSEKYAGSPVTASCPAAE